MSPPCRPESARRPPAPRREPAFGGEATAKLEFPISRKPAIFPGRGPENRGERKKSGPVCELFPMTTVLGETGQHTRTRSSSDQQAGTGGAGNGRPPFRVRVCVARRPDRPGTIGRSDRPIGSMADAAAAAMGIAPRPHPAPEIFPARPPPYLRRHSTVFPLLPEPRSSLGFQAAVSRLPPDSIASLNRFHSARSQFLLKEKAP